MAFILSVVSWTVLVLFRSWLLLSLRRSSLRSTWPELLGNFSKWGIGMQSVVQAGLSCSLLSQPSCFSTHTRKRSRCISLELNVSDVTGWCKAGNPLWKCRVMITGRAEAEAILELHNPRSSFRVRSRHMIKCSKNHWFRCCHLAPTPGVFPLGCVSVWLNRFMDERLVPVITALPASSLCKQYS